LRIAEALLLTLVVPLVFWLVVLPRVLAGWYVALLIPATVGLGAYLGRHD
jgi:hypothetical protein